MVTAIILGAVIALLLSFLILITYWLCLDPNPNRPQKVVNNTNFVQAD